jgi:hypothetical protein
MRVVPPREVLEDDKPRFGLRLEATAVEELALERGEEALTECVVLRVADGSHRRANTHLLAATPKRDRRVLPP